MHATAIHWPGLGGALLLGPSGAGKSDLALRLIAEGALLVADDQALLAASDGAIIARAPAAIAGLIEARGIGLVAVPSIRSTRLACAFTLAPGITPERLPEPETREVVPGGPSLPHWTLDPFQPSASVAIRLALRACHVRAR
ncbi:MAG: serine/threonine protein kinase [Alphaproteobacteria bacterium]|nr:serine/threonine protein kinase [Alphaproteobacteria bacterium]